MKRFSPLFAFLIISSFLACGPSQEQIDAQNKKTSDSLDSIGQLQNDLDAERMMAEQDSLDKIAADSLEKFRADSIRIQDSLDKKRGKKTIPKDGPKK